MSTFGAGPSVDRPTSDPPGGRDTAPCRVGPFPDTPGPEYAHRRGGGGIAPWCDLLREHFVALDVDDGAGDDPSPAGCGAPSSATSPPPW